MTRIESENVQDDDLVPVECQAYGRINTVGGSAIIDSYHQTMQQKYGKSFCGFQVL